MEVRQYSLTKEAWRFYSLLGQASQSTGTLTDTPPATPNGNVTSDSQEIITGYFGASAVSRMRFWLDRQGNTGQPLGLFYGLNNRMPVVSTSLANVGPCTPSDHRTPVKPDGWKE